MDIQAILATTFIDRLGNGVIDDDLVTPDFTCWAGGAGALGLGQFRMMIGYLAQLFPAGLTMTIEEPLVDGERAAVMAQSRGILDDGEIYANHYHYAFRFRDGRICEVREYADTALVTRIIAPRIRALMAAGQ